MHYPDLRETNKDNTKLVSALENVTSILQKDFTFRTENENDQVYSFLENIPYFRKHCQDQPDKTQAFIQICKAFRFESYPKNTALYHHNTFSQKVYLILEGEVVSYAPKNSTEADYALSPNRKTQVGSFFKRSNLPNNSKQEGKSPEAEVFRTFNMNKKYFNDDDLTFKLRKIYQPGDFLADLPIIFTGICEDTLIAWTDVKLVSIDKKDFKSIFENLIAESQERCSFFQQVFPKFSLNVLARLSYTCDRKVYKVRDKIYQQGSKPEELHIVKQGEVELWENYNIEEGKMENGKKLAKLENNSKAHQQAVKLSIVLLSQGQFFGEESLLEKEEREFTAIAKNMNTVTYVISKVSMAKLARYCSELVEYLGSQAQVSFDIKLKRSSNLKKGAEKNGLNVPSSLKTSSGFFQRKSRMSVAENNFSKEIVDLYANNIIQGKNNKIQNLIDNGVRSKIKEQSLSLSLSPNVSSMYKKMADLKTSMIYDHTKVDPKLMNEARQEEDEKNELPKISQGGSGYTMEKKYYYPEGLWDHEIKSFKEKIRKMRKDITEKEIANQIMESIKPDSGNLNKKPLETTPIARINSINTNFTKTQNNKFQPLSHRLHSEHSEEVGSSTPRKGFQTQRFGCFDSPRIVTNSKKTFFTTSEEPQEIVSSNFRNSEVAFEANDNAKQNIKKYLHDRLSQALTNTSGAQSPIYLSRADNFSKVSSQFQVEQQEATPTIQIGSPKSSIIKLETKMSLKTPKLKIHMNGIERTANKVAELERMKFNQTNAKGFGSKEFKSFGSRVELRNDLLEDKSPHNFNFKLPNIPKRKILNAGNHSKGVN